jgi:N utilization substance protein A
VIEFNPDPAVYISKALSPARVTGVYLNDTAKGTKTATVVVPEDQLSLAIGRDGQNARLAAKLTSWRIDIKSLPEGAGDSLHKLQTEEEYAFMREREQAVVVQVQMILAKKAESRPVTPEEYQVLAQFVDRVERGVIQRREAERRSQDSRIKEVRATLPDPAFEMPLVDLPLSDRVYKLLVEAGYDSVGSVMLQMELDSDAILALSGVGPKALDEIKSIVSTLEFETPAPEAEAETEAVVEEQPTEEAAAVMGAVEEAVSEAAAPEVVAPEIATTDLVAESTDAVAEAAADAVAEAVSETDEEPGAQLDVEEDATLDQLFALRPEVFDGTREVIEEEDDETGDKKGKKGKKAKKRRFVEMEYDPDLNEMIVKRKHKNEDEWDDNWKL